MFAGCPGALRNDLWVSWRCVTHSSTDTDFFVESSDKKKTCEFTGVLVFYGFAGRSSDNLVLDDRWRHDVQHGTLDGDSAQFFECLVFCLVMDVCPMTFVLRVRWPVTVLSMQLSVLVWPSMLLDRGRAYRLFPVTVHVLAARSLSPQLCDGQRCRPRWPMFPYGWRDTSFQNNMQFLLVLPSGTIKIQRDGRGTPAKLGQCYACDGTCKATCLAEEGNLTPDRLLDSRGDSVSSLRLLCTVRHTFFTGRLNKLLGTAAKTYVCLCHTQPKFHALRIVPKQLEQYDAGERQSTCSL